MLKRVVQFILGQAGKYLALIMSRVGDKQVLDAVLAVAMKHVRDLFDKDTYTNAQKRSMAFDSIVSDLKPVGLQVGESLINLAIELAVNAIKAELKG
jgi:hypothetical protein